MSRELENWPSVELKDGILVKLDVWMQLVKLGFVFKFPVKEVAIYPVQWHALRCGLFASVIALFGGFFASGFKRDFKIKDFGDSIPRHGGFTDQMDYQAVHEHYPRPRQLIVENDLHINTVL